MGIICSKGVVLSLPLYIHKNTVIAHGYGMILRIISGSTYYNHTVWRSCYRCYVKQPLWGSCNVKTGSWKRKEYMGNKNSQYGCNTQKLVKLFVYVILYTEMLPHPHTSFFFFFDGHSFTYVLTLCLPIIKETFRLHGLMKLDQLVSRVTYSPFLVQNLIGE